MAPEPPPIPDAALAELAALYRELDAALAALAVPCRQCGQCCDFARNDYRLYASLIERELAARGHGVPRLTADGLCGFCRNQRCGAGGRCSIHAVRPLGCRVSYCDPAHKAREQDLCHAWQRRLRALVDRHGLPWGYGPFFQDG